MRFFVGITDGDWFDFLSRMDGLDEVNFWQPSGQQQFRALQIGEPFLFKLHSPDDYIVGGGFFSHFTILPASIVWQAFAERNGARTEEEMRAEDRPIQTHADSGHGCRLPDRLHPLGVSVFL